MFVCFLILQDILNLGIYNYIRDNMGQTFLDPPPFNMKSSFDDSNSCSPLVFILSPGADPIADLFLFGTLKRVMWYFEEGGVVL